MDDKTGHLIQVEAGQDMPAGYTSVPLQLEAVAQAALAKVGTG